MNKRELMAKLKALGPISEEQKKTVVCALVGHSKIQSQFWGYFSCGRCGQQVGDSLGGAYKATDVVVIGHDCETCHKNYDALGWEHKLFVSSPFKIEAQVEVKP